MSLPASDSPTPDDATWWVVCLCAEWCGTCRDWRAPLQQLAATHPDVRFAWVDIEDQAAEVGDLDIETFPTLLVAHGERVRFFGPVLPQVAQVGRLLASLQADPEAGTQDADAQELLHRLRAAKLKPI